jgi:RNA polymerase primary sigma factor
MLGALFRLTLASGVAAAVALHIRRGAPLDGRDAQGRTPLMLAAMRGHVDVCRLLLQAGADAKLRDLNGMDAAGLARAKGHSLILALIEAEASTGSPNVAETLIVIRDAGEAASVSANLSPKKLNLKQPEAPTALGLAPLSIVSNALCTANERVEVFDVSAVMDGAEKADGQTLEEGCGPACMIMQPNEDGAQGAISAGSSEKESDKPQPEVALSLAVDEEAIHLTAEAGPPSTQNLKADQTKAASDTLFLSRGATITPKQGKNDSSDALGAPTSADALVTDATTVGGDQSAWEPELEPDLTHSGGEIAAAAAELESAVSRHTAQLPATDWNDTHIELPDTAPPWAEAFRKASGGFREVTRLISGGLREGWILAEELDALQEMLVEGEKGRRLVTALETLLSDLGILIEDEHAIDWARIGIAEYDDLKASEIAYDVTAAVERLTEMWIASPDAEGILLSAIPSAPVLSKALEMSLFHDLAALLTFMQGVAAANPVSASLLEAWAEQLEARSVVPREISEIAWGIGDEGASAHLEPDQDVDALSGETTFTDLPDIAGHQAAEALAAHLRATAKMLLKQGTAEELVASAKLTPRRILELTEACLGRQGVHHREGLRASIRRSTATLDEFAVLRPPALRARRRVEPLDLADAFQRYIDVRQAIVEANLRRVVWLARRHTRAAVPFLDLVQEGQIGLLRAIDRFDPNRGFRFGTYATYWIRQSISRYVQDQGRTIRIPVHMLERLVKAKRVSEALRAKNGEDPTPQELAAALETDVASVERVFAADLEGVGFEDMKGESYEGAPVLAPLVAEATPLAALLHDDLRLLLAASLRTLDARQARIIDLRFGLTDGDPLTLEEVGQMYGVTRERIRQIEAKTLRRLPRLFPTRRFENLVP